MLCALEQCKCRLCGTQLEGDPLHVEPDSHMMKI